MLFTHFCILFWIIFIIQQIQQCVCVSICVFMCGASAFTIAYLLHTNLWQLTCLQPWARRCLLLCWYIWWNCSRTKGPKCGLPFLSSTYPTLFPVCSVSSDRVFTRVLLTSSSVTCTQFITHVGQSAQTLYYIVLHYLFTLHYCDKLEDFWVAR